MDLSRFAVPIDQLRWRCDEACFSFQCTDEVAPLQEFIGQDRAISAIEFGLGVHQPGYNIFVTGVSGTGRATIIKAHLEEVVKQKKERGEAASPSDWCYIYDFANPDEPKILSLPAGMGRRFKSAVEQLHQALQREIAGAIASDEYGARRKAITLESQTRQRALFEALDAEARAEGFTVQLTPMGVSLVPVKNDGKPMAQDEYLELPEEVRQASEQRRQALAGKVEAALEAAREVEVEAARRLAELGRRVAEFAASGPFKTAARQFADHPKVQEFLEALRTFAVEHAEVGRPTSEEGGQPDASQDGKILLRERQTLLPFLVNVFVDNTGADGPPIVIENNPTYSNLFGKVDRRFVLGAYVTDHTMLKPGSISLANGGYLVLPVRQLLMNPLVWETLKRVIKERSVRLEDPAEVIGFPLPQSIRPEPMPLDVKVVVTGDNFLYSLLAANDEDFWETFKVKADFDYEIQRTPRHLEAYASFVGRICGEGKLLHLEPSGVARVVEHAARLVANQTKLSTRFGQLKDLLIEADYWARKEGASRVTGCHVDRALEQKVFRSNLVAERIQELIAEGTFMVDIVGQVVGQVNGLAVYSVGDFSFGRPSRITARTFLGRAGVINIEREAKLSGKTYDKGLLILSGYLAWKYAQRQPLSVSASVAMEQSYEGIDGDSASSTEMYAILSSLADVPLQQSIAVTGSMNQKGEVQAIGGVNEKIEGFFDVCKVIGLTGEQGVMIPRQNVRNLMLRQDVVEAVAQGQFHVYAVSTIDEGIEVLTGVPFGVRGPDGMFPEGVINERVERHLQEYARAQREAARRNGTGGEAEQRQEHGPSEDRPAQARGSPLDAP